MTLIFENDKIAPTLTLAVFYLLLSIYAARRLSILHEKVPGIGPSKLFVINSFLVSLLRCLTFGSMSIFNYLEFHALIRTDMRSSIISTSSSSGIANDMGDTTTDLFFEKATLVLFDLPDFCCISAYVLLILVCAEAQLQARHHWLPGDGYHLRRGWLLGFMIFNAVLYSVQVSLYSLLFFPQVNQRILTNCIYLTMTVLNLGIPLFYLVGFLTLTIYFAGFPFTSSHAKLRLHSLVRLSVAWSVTRLLWGIIALTSVVQGWLAMAEENEHYYGLTLVLLFVVTEIGPILWGLDETVITYLAETSALTGMGPGGDGRDSSTLHHSLKHSLDWAEEGQAFRSDPGYYGNNNQHDPVYDSFGRRKGVGKTTIPSHYGSLNTDHHPLDAVESTVVGGVGIGSGSEERSSRRDMRRNARRAKREEEADEEEGEKKEEDDEITTTTTTMRREKKRRDVETAPLFATGGAMVAHVEVGGGGGTPPQGQGLGTGLRSGFGPEQNDDDEQGYEGEEGQWVENDTSSNCNSPPSFSPTITSSSTPAIASRIAAFEHNVSLDPSSPKPARQAIRSWFDFGLGTGKETGLETGKPSSSSSAASSSSSATKADDIDKAPSSLTAGVGMDVNALYAAAPGGKPHGIPVVINSNTAVNNKQDSSVTIGGTTSGRSRTVINATNHQESASHDHHCDEMKEEATHHDLTEGGMINETRADDDASVGSHTDDSFVSALEGDILRLGSLDDASLSSGGSWDTEDSRSPSRSQEHRTRTHDGSKRRKKREKRMVIMERGGSVLLPDCSPYFESGLGKVVRNNSNDDEASSGSDSEETGDSGDTFLSPLNHALRQQHRPTDRRTWGQWLGSWGKGGGSNPPTASPTDHRDRPDGAFGLNGSSSVDRDDVSI